MHLCTFENFYLCKLKENTVKVKLKENLNPISFFFGFVFVSDLLNVLRFTQIMSRGQELISDSEGSPLPFPPSLDRDQNLPYLSLFVKRPLPKEYFEYTVKM